jgi:hypothetical protein
MHPEPPPLGGREFRFAGRACFTGGHFSQLNKEHLLTKVLLCDTSKHMHITNLFLNHFIQTKKIFFEIFAKRMRILDAWIQDNQDFNVPDKCLVSNFAIFMTFIFLHYITTV